MEPVGSGSGIHSFAALRLGASRVLSFDYASKSVALSKGFFIVRTAKA
jgi:ribosomal protein L11 methylase PrmA